jgi:putative ABC transport system ATP-binding protein
VITIQQLSFHYARSTFTLRVPALTVADGEKVALIGPSGSGKTTLLYLIAGILLPDAGDITVGDARPAQLNDSGRRAFRIATLGLVFQDFQLLESLDVLENILLPYRINPELNLTPEVRDRALQLARETGLDQRLRHRPGRLSQGEKQRTALCRALINWPECLLADEPTGNLDPQAKTRVLDVLFEQCARARASLLMVTHDLGLLGRFDRAINLAELSP